MAKQINFIDISVYDRNIQSIQDEIDLTPHSIGHLQFLDAGIDLSVVRFGARHQEIPPYYLYRYRFLDLLRCYRFLQSKKTAVVLFHGFSFPLRFWVMRFLLGKKKKWIIQHHAGDPSKNFLKRWVQKWSYAKADGYFFVSKAQAAPFIKAGLIRSETQVSEVMECSVAFSVKDKNSARTSLGIPDGKPIFIWVGGLDNNKDPLCMLEALAGYKQKCGDFRLYMFFGDDSLLATVKRFVDENGLGPQVVLKGRIPNTALENWYNAADYFISCSHSEGSGLAVAEAMACGCIPLLSNIPPFVSMTQRKVGFLYETGNPDALLALLQSLDFAEIPQQRIQTRQVFEDGISFQAIARDTSHAVMALSQ